jgi:uncharacterized protein YjiK
MKDIFLVVLFSLFGLFILEIIVFEAIWPIFSKKTMLQFKIQMIHYWEWKYQVVYKQWPFSPWWSDIAALDGWSADSQTLFNTIEEAEQEVREIITKRKKNYSKVKVKEIKTYHVKEK